MNSITDMRIVIRGGGDIASGVACRLKRCGFPVIMLEIAKPTVVRRKVAFADAIYEGEATVEGLRGKRADDAAQAAEMWKSPVIPVLVDPEGASIARFMPDAVVDCILAKKNPGTYKNMASIVIGIGPGFTAPEDVDAVIETNRGHHLGRVIMKGTALPDTNLPGNIEGYTEERILRACDEGIVRNMVEIGSLVRAGDVICRINGKPVISAISGAVRGLIRDGLHVGRALKIGDIDPRGEVSYCFTVSDKARAIGGGVLEALLVLGAGTANMDNPLPR